MSDNTSSNEVTLHDAPITVLGLGHIGLPTALGLAELGRTVIDADDDPATVALIRAGQPPFYEPRLSDLLSKHLKTGKFRPVEDVKALVRSGSITFRKTPDQAGTGQAHKIAP